MVGMSVIANITDFPLHLEMEFEAALVIPKDEVLTISFIPEGDEVGQTIVYHMNHEDTKTGLGGDGPSSEAYRYHDCASVRDIGAASALGLYGNSTACAPSYFGGDCFACRFTVGFSS
jgi:hypothetical protein